MVGAPAVDTGTVELRVHLGHLRRRHVPDRRHRQRGRRPADPGAHRRRLRHQPRRPRRRRPRRLADRRTPSRPRSARSRSPARSARPSRPTSTRRSPRSTRPPTAIDFRADADFFATPRHRPDRLRPGARCARPRRRPTTCPAPTRRSAPPRRRVSPTASASSISASAFNQLLGADDRVRHPQPDDHRVRARRRSAAADHRRRCSPRSCPSSPPSCPPARRCASS